MRKENTTLRMHVALDVNARESIRVTGGKYRLDLSREK